MKFLPLEMLCHPTWKPFRAFDFPVCLQSVTIWALLLALSSICRADPLLDLALDDPGNLLSSYPEGASELPRSFLSSTATIASGFGGRALPQITAGPPGETPTRPGEVRVQMAKEPSLGNKSFFRATLLDNPSTRSVGVGILTDSTLPIRKMISYQDQTTKLDGALDFFFRLNSNNEPPKLTVSTKVAQMGVILGSNEVTRKMFLKIFTAGKSLDTNGDRAGDKAGIEKQFDAPLENDAIYHAALNFRTAADGSLIVDFCLQHGTGPMVANSSIVASIDSFWLAEDQSPSTEKISIQLGRSATSSQTLDIAAMRVFAPSPAVFPCLDTPNP